MKVKKPLPNKTITLAKMTALGNDFILMEGIHQAVPSPLEPWIARICRRRLSIGADGFLLLHPSEQADLKVSYWNADGSSANLCLNGTRCAARYAHTLSLAPRVMKLKTDAGIWEAEVQGNQVRLSFPERTVAIHPYTLTIEGETLQGWLVDVGVPHFIVITPQWDRKDFVALARTIRFHEALKPEGANVSFVFLEKDDLLRMRTYERGVEDEVMACSSGAWAALEALSSQDYPLRSPLTVLFKAELPLRFYFQKIERKLVQLGMEGEARFLFVGKVSQEAWRW